MKKLLKGFFSFTKQLFDTIVSIFSALLFSSYKVDKYFKRQRKARTQGEVCNILCNGPSLAPVLDSDHPVFENSFAVNYFAFSEHYQKIKPNNYIVLDNADTGTVPLTEQEKKDVERFYNIMVYETNWPMTFYYPNNGKKEYIDIISKNKNINVVVYNMTPISGFKKVCHWLYRHSLGMPRPQNISNAAVFCALNAGFKKIYLYGAELSWMKQFEVHPKTHKLYMNDGHFYEEDNIRWFERGTYCNWLLYIHMGLKSHFDLREYADSIGAKIINKCPTSYIEAYEFEEY